MNEHKDVVVATSSPEAPVPRLSSADDAVSADATDRVWTVPNAISAFRLVLVPVFAVLIAQQTPAYDLAAFGVLAFAGFSDWLDGVIARRFNQGSRLGQLLDPAADRLYILVTLVMLAWRDVVPWWLVIVLVVRDLLLAALLPLLARKGYGPLPVHFVGKAGTFALLYAFPLLLLTTWAGWLGSLAYALGWAFTAWGTALYWLAAVLYVRQAVGLLRGPGLT